MAAAFSGRAKRYQALTLLAGVLLAFAAFAAVIRFEANERRHDFLELANDHALLVQTTFARAVEAGLAAAVMFDGEGAVRRARFQAAIAPFLRHKPGVRAVEWVPRVKAADRASLEAAARRDGLSGFTFTERDAVGNLVPAAARDEYFPVYFMAPVAGNEAVLGFDLGSSPARAEAMARARDSGQPYASDRVRLVHAGRPASLIFTPAYRGGTVPATVAERRETLIGFSLVVFDVNAALANVMATDDGRRGADVHGRATGAIAIYVFDDNPNAAERVLAAHGVEDAFGDDGREPTETDAVAGLHLTRALDMAGRTWEIVVRSAVDPDRIPGWAWGTLALCLGLAAALSVLVRARVGQDQAIRHLVRRQTAELATTARTLRELHAIASDQIFTLDDKIERTLMLGIRHFGESVGVVGEIAGGLHTVRHLVGPDWVPKAGTTRPLAETFCSLTVAAGKSIAVADADAGPYRDHPASRAGVKSYIGAPLRVEGKLYGTLGFSSPRPRGEAFDEGDLSLIQMMAEWVGTLMGRRRQIERLHQSNVELRDSESRLSAIFGTVMDGIVTIDEQGLMETVNPAAEVLFGYTAGEMIGRNLKMLMPEPYASHHDGYLAAYRKTGQAKIIGVGREGVGRRKDGGEFPLDLAISEVRIGGRRVFVGVVRDLTERKRIERLHKEFVSTVSHELRTPLTSIVGSLGLIRGGALGAIPDKILRLVEIAHANSDRLVRLINDILDIEKIESGKFEFRMTPVDLSSLVEQAIESNRGYAERLKVAIAFDRRTDQAMVFGDSDRLTQVMANLFSNAAKFSPPDGTVAVVLDRRDDWVRISVQDRGAGIPAHFRDKIFGRFSQADASDSRAKGGTGLGLNITKAIVERHGGRIWFESEKGRGTTFHVELPRTDVADRSEDAGMSAAGRRILVCEDDRDIASVLALILRPAGFAVDIAYTLAAARAMLAAKRYDALSLDLVLPDGDGIQLIRELRADPRTAALPVVVVSARAREGRAVVNGHAVGVLDWLEKPVKQERLLAALETVFKRAASRPARILHVEDDAATREVVAALIGDRAEVTAAATVAEARARLEEGRFDLAILDLGLPDGSGKDLLPLLKPANGAPATPVVVLSVTETDADLAGAVNAALVKTRTSNENLLNTILSMIPIAAGGTEPRPKRPS